MREVRLLLLVMTSVLGAAEPTVTTWYVAPQGRDAGPGTADQPFATLERAQVAVRQRSPGVAAEVVLQPGTWYLERPVVFGAADSGTPTAPVTIRAAKAGTVRLIGGRLLAGRLLAPVTDPDLRRRLPEAARDQVRMVSLASIGLKLPPAPTRAFTGTGDLPSLYEDDQLLPVAQWPAQGFTTIAKVEDSGQEPKPHGGIFLARDERVATWAGADPTEGWWLEGYWRVPWVMEGVPAAQIAAAERRITLGLPISGGIGSKYSPVVAGTRTGDGKERFRVRNLLEELDTPGEWILHRPSASLIIWPRGGAAARLTLVSGTGPTLQLREVSHLSLERLGIEGGRSAAVDIVGGQGVALRGCQIRNSPGQGITIQGGRDHVVQSCDLEDLGSTAIRVQGGSREQLTPGGHQILNNHLHHFGLITRVVSGITLDGVGLVIRNNLIHDSPYGGITLTGNDHRIEGNEIHHIGLEGGDLGGIYTGADWTSWGTHIRHNLIHHSPTANGIYLDDGDSGDDLEGNIFYGLASGLFIGGGSCNHARDNVVMACEVAIHLDDRGVPRRYGAPDSSQRRKAEQLKITQHPWSERYPALVAWYTTEDLSLPTGNVLEKTLAIGCRKVVDCRGKNRERFQVTDTREVADNPGYADPAHLDFRSTPGATGLPKIPVERIGLQVDAWRPVLPTAAATGRFLDRKPGIDFRSTTDLDRTNQQATQKP